MIGYEPEYYTYITYPDLRSTIDHGFTTLVAEYPEVMAQGPTQEVSREAAQTMVRILLGAGDEREPNGYHADQFVVVARRSEYEHCWHGCTPHSSGPSVFHLDSYGTYQDAAARIRELKVEDMLDSESGETMEFWLFVGSSGNFLMQTIYEEATVEVRRILAQRLEAEQARVKKGAEAKAKRIEAEERAQLTALKAKYEGGANG